MKALETIIKKSRMSSRHLLLLKYFLNGTFYLKYLKNVIAGVY